MKILYISTVNSKRKYKDLFASANGALHHSIQKFHQLIISGLKENDNDVTVLSGLQISSKTVNKRIFLAEKEKEEDISYLYPFILNFPGLKQLCTIFSFIFFFIFWFFRNKKEKNVIIDAAYVSVAPIMVFLCKLFNVKCTCVVADIYNYMTLKVNVTQKRTFFEKISCRICNYCWKNYDNFVLLTEQMNDVINPLNKPYLVMEGLVDNDYTLPLKVSKRKNAIMYAGGLTERYGVKLLIDAFNEWGNNEFELWLCGAGDLEKYITTINNPKIKYFGVLTQEEVTKLEQQATLLVNPRFTNEEYTKYSFPSKNMEYMLSGTPVLTTKLSGMPKEYYDYVYLLEDETKEGLINKFNELLFDDSILDTGKKAQDFVINNKHNVIQTNRIITKIKEIKKEKRSPKEKLISCYVLVNLFLLFLSSLNIYGLYNVSSKTYFIYIVSIFFVLLGLTRKIEKKQFDTKEKIRRTTIKILNSKGFKILLFCSMLIILWYFLKYMYIIRDLPPEETRMAAFTKLYSNAVDAVFYLYIVSNINVVFTILIPLLIFDKTLKHRSRKINLIIMIISFILFSLIGFGRFNFLNIILAFFFTIVYFIDFKSVFNKKNIIAFIITIVAIFGVSVLFMYVRVFSASESTGIFTLISYQFKQIFEYFLGSFRTLDNFLKHGFSIANYTFGRATLAGFDEIILYPIKFLGSEVLNFNQIISPITQEGIAVGHQTPYYNAFYTSIMNFYLDFGFLGVCFFSYLHGLFINYIFKLYKERETILSKILVILVSTNLLMCVLKWNYQAGNMVFLVVLLLIAENFDKIRKKTNVIKLKTKKAN